MLFSWQSPPLKPLQTTPYLVSRNHHIVKAIRSGPFHEFPSPPRRGSLSVRDLNEILEIYTIFERRRKARLVSMLHVDL